VKRRVLFGVALVTLAGVASVQADGTPPLAPRWSAALGVQSADDIPAALKRPFDAPFDAVVAGVPEVRLDDCEAWRVWRGRIRGARPESDYAALRGQGVQCDALALLRTVRAARHSALPADLDTLTDARLYPATLWIAISDDAVAELAKPGRTLAAAAGVRRWQAERKGLVLQDDTQGVRLVWLARGDFDGDGWEDALYRWQASIRDGSWTDVRLVLLTRRGSSARLVELRH